MTLEVIKNSEDEKGQKFSNSHKLKSQKQVALQNLFMWILLGLVVLLLAVILLFGIESTNLVSPKTAAAQTLFGNGVLSSTTTTTTPVVITPNPKSSQPAKVLTVVLRDSHGKPLAGVECQVLSYGWGLQIGEPFAVIADGETDQNGVIAFDDTVWPADTYRFRFEPTNHTSPADTYFLPDSQNQYHGYPAADIGLEGGPNQTEYFVIAGDGLAYNDLSYGKGVPDYDKDSAMGLNKPGVNITIMSSDNYFATVRAATATAFAGGFSLATTPPVPPTFDGTPAAPLTQTPSAAALTAQAFSEEKMNQAFEITATANAVFLATVAAQNPTSTIFTATHATNSNNLQGTLNPSSEKHQANLAQSTLMALIGIASLVLFWRYRYQLYRLLGLPIEVPVKRSRQNLKNKKVKSNSRTKTALQINQKIIDRTTNNNRTNRKDAE